MLLIRVTWFSASLVDVGLVLGSLALRQFRSLFHHSTSAPYISSRISLIEPSEVITPRTQLMIYS
jgi:hypothetical protein